MRLQEATQSTSLPNTIHKENPLPEDATLLAIAQYLCEKTNTPELRNSIITVLDHLKSHSAPFKRWVETENHLIFLDQNNRSRERFINLLLQKKKHNPSFSLTSTGDTHLKILVKNCNHLFTAINNFPKKGSDIKSFKELNSVISLGTEEQQLFLIQELIQCKPKKVSEVLTSSKDGDVFLRVMGKLAPAAKSALSGFINNNPAVLIDILNSLKLPLPCGTAYKVPNDMAYHIISQFCVDTDIAEICMKNRNLTEQYPALVMTLVQKGALKAFKEESLPKVSLLHNFLTQNSGTSFKQPSAPTQ